MVHDPESTVTKPISAGLPAKFAERGLIGKGGMSVVLRAFDRERQQDVAIKLLLCGEDPVKDLELRKRFEREAKTMLLLDHPSIVKLLDWGISNSGNPFHVLEYLDGEPLSALLERSGRLGPVQFRQVFSQVLSGLSYAHKKSLVHRDLKPSNIMIVRQGKTSIVKLIDFGIARTSEKEISGDTTTSLGLTQNLLGSPAYMSPEQCRGSQVDSLSDIYSLGCVMYQALTGRLPFETKSAMDVMYQHINADWVRLENTFVQPEFVELGRLVDKCLAKNPPDRPQSADEMLEVLNRNLGSQQDTRQSFKLKLDKPASKSPLLSAAIAAGFVIAATLTFCSLAAHRAIEERQASAASSRNKAVIKAQLEHEANVTRRLKASISESARIFKETEDETARRTAAFEFIKSARHLADRQSSEKQYRSAEETLSKIFPYSTYMDAPALVQSATYKEIGRLRMQAGDTQGALKACQQAMDALAKTGDAEGDYASGIWNLRTLCHLRARQFEAAEEDLTQLKRSWMGHIVASGPASRIAYSINTNRWLTMQAMCDCIGEEIPASTEDKMKALSFLNNLCLFVIESYPSSEPGHFAHTTKRLLAGIPRSTPGYNSVAARAYKNLAGFAALAGKKMQSAEFRKKASRLEALSKALP